MADIRVKDLAESSVPGADYYLLTDSATDGVKKVKTTNIVKPSDIGAAASSDLARVATSGSYNDLAGLPTLGAMAAKNAVALSDISATGAPSSTTALFGDGTWKVPAGGGDMLSSTYDPTNKLADAFNSANTKFVDAGGSISDVQTSIRSLKQDKPISYFDFVPFSLQRGIADGTDTTTDQGPFWSAFIAALSAISSAGGRPNGLIPQCTIYTSQSPNLAMNFLTLETHGNPHIINTARGTGINIDGTGMGAGAYGVRFMNIGQLTASTITGDYGWFIRRAHQSIFHPRNLGAVTAGIKTHFCVSSTFKQPTCTNQVSPFLSAAPPAIGLHVTGAVNEQTSWCKFDTPIMEYVPAGIQLDYALGNMFNGGTAEGCSVVGLTAGTNARFNKINGVDFESNTSFDAYFAGAYNTWNAADSSSVAYFDAGAIGNTVFGGNFTKITLNSGANLNTFFGAKYNQGGGGWISDGGTGNRFVDCLDVTAGKFYNAWQPYTVTPSAESGAFNAASATGSYQVTGDTVDFQVSIVVTDNGTAAGGVLFNLPLPSATYATFSGEELVLTGKSVASYVAPAGMTAHVRFYDGTYPAASGSTIVVTGRYQRG